MSDALWESPQEYKKYLVGTFPELASKEALEDFDLHASEVKGYEGFGSFHSQNVEELVAIPDDQYVPPTWPNIPWANAPATLHTFPNAIVSSTGNIWHCNATSTHARVAFGKEFAKEHFAITKDFVFVNHGAFGGALSGAQAMKVAIDQYMESQILRFYDRELLPLLVFVIRELSRFLGAKAKQVVLVQNATFGLNSAIRHLIKPKDVVAYLDSEYLSVYKMAFIRCEEVGASLHEVPINFLLPSHEILADDQRLTDHICSHLPEGCSVFIVDMISSTSALLFPVFSHLIPALRARGVKRIIVDGAHAPLQCELNFDSLPTNCQPDAFIGNLHKWTSCPKAAAFIWLREEATKLVEPAVISHGAREGLLSSFIWDGTRDYSSYLTVPAVLSFWRAQGFDSIRTNCANLLREVVAMLNAAFGNAEAVVRHAPFMAIVLLPQTLQNRKDITAKYVQDVLHSYYRLEVPVKQIDGKLYLRISVFVYNDRSDYAYVRDSVLDFIERIRKRPRESGTPCPQQKIGGCGVVSQAKMKGF